MSPHKIPIYLIPFIYYNYDMARQDPRADIVDGSHEISLDLSSRIDTLKSMRDYFLDIYSPHSLGFSPQKQEIKTLLEWNKRHIEFYNEATRLIEECIDMGYYLDPREVQKLRDYHLEKASFLASVIQGKRAKKEADGESASSSDQTSSSSVVTNLPNP